VGYDFDTGLEAERGDLTLYYDADDCRGGAIFGHNDRDLIHLLGRKTPAELAQVARLPAPAPVLTPLDDTAQGAAFVVTRKNGTYAIVRLTLVTPATFDQLKRGGTARIEFEWRSFTPLR
jgi:hypothetical protein